MTPAVSRTKPWVARRAADVHLARTDEPALLAHGDDEFDGGMGNLGVGSEHGQQLQTSGQPGLVVRAKDRRAVGPDDPVVTDDRDHPAVGAGRVHMGGDQDGPVASPRIGRHDVADRILGRRAPERSEPRLEHPTDLLLVTGRAIDGDEVEEGAQQPVRIHLGRA
jgi:hypothetical protein